MCTTRADVPGTGRFCILIDLKYSRAGDGMGFLWLLILFQLLGLSSEAFRSHCLDRHKPWSESLIRKARAWCSGQRKRAGYVLWEADIQEHPCSSAPWSRSVEFSGGLQLGFWAALLDVPSVGCAGTAGSAHEGQFAASSASLQFAQGGDLVS